MIAPLRRLHRVGWIALSVPLAILLVAALLATDAPPTSGAATALRRAESTPEAIEGCWGDLPVRLHTSSVAGSSGDEPGTRSSSTDHVSDSLEAGAASSTIISFAGGQTLELSGNEVLRLRLPRTRVTRLEVIGTPHRGALAGYQAPGRIAAKSGLPKNARFLGQVSGIGATLDVDDVLEEGSSSLLLYSLPHEATVGAILLMPEAIVVGSCP